MNVYLFLPRSEPDNLRIVVSPLPIERAYHLLPGHLKQGGSYFYNGPNRLTLFNPPAKFVRISGKEERCYHLGDF